MICPDTNVLLAVLDVDSDLAAAFTEEDARGMEALCGWFAAQSFAKVLVDGTGVTLE